MLDFITVVFRDELPLLEIQARSFDQYLNPKDVDQIVVVVNDDDSVADSIDPAWWGKYSNYVSVKLRSEYKFTPGNSGWDDQQLLKLLCAAQSQTKWSIVFDAKTWLIKPLDTQESALFDTQGRPNVGRMHLSPHFEPARQFVENYYGISIDQVLGPSGVPYVFHSEDVREMIAGIPDFITFFQQAQINPTLVTEFVLYAGFILKKYSCLDAIYNVDRIYICVANLADWQVDKFDTFTQAINQHHTITASIHRRAYKHLTQEQLSTWVLFLESRNLINNNLNTLKMLNTYIK
jgi:hypothetical protein